MAEAGVTPTNNPEIGKIVITVNEKDFEIVCSTSLTALEVFHIMVAAVNDLAQRDLESEETRH